MITTVRSMGLALLVIAASTSAPAQSVASFADTRGTSVAATRSQNVLDRPARLTVENVPLSVGLTRLHQKSGVPLAFSPSLLPGDRSVSCRCEDRSVGEALDHLLLGTSFGYVELGNQVLIEPRTEPRPSLVALAAAPRAGVATRPVSPVPISLLRNPGLARFAGTITGQVVEARTRRPLAGVQISIPGSGLGALTNNAGRYLLLNVPAGEVEVRAQLIGYGEERTTVAVADGQTATANFALAEQALALDEVVVTGTAGAARKREIGNAISQINLADVPEPVTNTDALLQGRASGLTVIQNTGQVGGGASLRLRGNVSATMSNQPLIYVDGVRTRSDGYPKNTFPVGYSGNSDNTVYSPLNDIDPAEIERIEVIKGPAATTLYGTEAAAGVIQIFTKRGKPGQARWTAQVDQGLSRVQKFGPTRGFDGDPLVVPENEINPFGTHEYMYLEPWLKDAWRQKYFLSVDGGREDLQYYLSGALDNTEGVLPNDLEKQFSLRGNFSSAPLQNLQLQWNTSYARNNISKTPTGGTAAGLTLNAFRRDRNYFGSKDPEVISRVLEFDLSNYIDRFITGVTATYAPGSALTNRLTVGYDLAQQETRGIMPYGFPLAVTGQAHNQRWTNRTLTADYVGSLNFGLLPELRSSFSWGAQSVTTEETSITAASLGFPGPGVPTVSSGATKLGFEERLRVVNAGFFFQNLFDFKGRYFVTTGIRFDGNSAFGSNLGLQAYPKISFSYIISEEPFWRPSLGTVKLRGAYGQSGRAPGAFDAVQTFEPVSWGSGTAFVPLNLGNPDLGPERTAEWELGLDGAFLADRLTLDFTYYQRRTTDALFEVRQPPSTGGWRSQLANVGELASRGMELAADLKLLQRQDFGWDVGATVATNRSETVDLGGAAPFSLNNRGWIVEGQPAPVMRGLCVRNPDERAAPIIERDCNIGPNTPTLTLTGNTAVYLPRGMSLSARGEYQGGHYAYSLMDGESITRGIRWPACFNAYPHLDAGNLDELTARERAMCIASNANRDFAIFPMDFFRLRDVTFSAPLPFQLPRASSTRISLSAQNVYTWKKASDSFLDPETSGGFTTGNTGMSEKVHSVGGSIPIPATFLISVRAVF